MKENDEDNLALFEFDAHPGSMLPRSSPVFKIVVSPSKTVGDKNDYDWLLSPPGSPFISSLEMELQNGNHIGCAAELNTRFLNCEDEPASKEISPITQISPSMISSSNGDYCQTSSSESQIYSIASLPETPTAHHTASLPVKSGRPIIATSRATLPSFKSMASTTRSVASSARSSTPAARSSEPARKSMSNPLRVSSVSVPPGRSSSVGRMGLKTRSNPAPSRGNSTTRTRPQKTSNIPASSTNTPPDLKSLTTERPVSKSSCRSGASNSNGKLRQCSPPRGQGPSKNAYSNGSSRPAVRRAYSTDEDNVNPVLMGTKMVDRVVNMRKLAPPKQDNRSNNNSSGKPSSYTSLGFGRSLSKSSLDMAMRHMDIGGSMPGKLRPLKTKGAAYSLQSGGTRSRSTSVSDSPPATSSNASSELSIHSTTYSLDVSEPDEDVGSDTKM
ncbi:hypothetical protein ACHQM5_020914 [Ranunculus cassubicifolius]